MCFYDRKITILPGNAAHSRLGMSVTTQGGSGRQYVTGTGQTISKYRIVFFNVYRFQET